MRLEAAAGPVRIGGLPAAALSYNGGLPRPILRLEPRDRLTDPTDLHVHVSPEGNGDNAFVEIDPGTTFDYDYQLGERTHPRRGLAKY